MAAHVGLVSVLVVSLSSAALGCLLPPAACTAEHCNILPTQFPNTAANFSAPDTWKQAYMRGIGFYKGVYNKIASIANSNGMQPYLGTFDAYSAVRGVSANGYPLIVNLERFAVEPAYVLWSGGGFTLKTCCNGCRTTQGCVLYNFQPPCTMLGCSSGYDLTNAYGTCYLLTGGTYKNDGPFNPITGVNYGAPFSGSSSQQAPGNSTNTNKLSYVGGFCNPGNGSANVVDDPHFVGARGTRFDFNGELEKSYCLITDTRVHVNVLLKGYKDDNTFGSTVGADGKATRSWIKEAAFLWTDGAGKGHTLHLVSRAGKEQKRGDGFLVAASLDGVAMPVPSTPGEALVSRDMTLTFLKTSLKGPYEVDRFRLVVRDLLDVVLTMRVAHPLLQTKDEAHVHFNLLFHSVSLTDKVHGVLGQTYRSTPSQILKAMEYKVLSRLLREPIQADGGSGSGFLDGAVGDYVSSHVLNPDCKVTSFVSSE